MIRFLNNGLWGLFEPCEKGLTDALSKNFFAIDVLMQAQAISFVDELPASPSLSDVYILNQAFETYAANSILAYNGLKWVELIPHEGEVFYIDDENSYYQFNGTDWILYSTALSINSGINLKWHSVFEGAPIDQADENFGEVFNFSVGNNLISSFKIDSNFVQIVGKQGKIKFHFSTPTTSGKVKWRLTSTLVSLVDGVDSQANQHTDEIEIDLDLPTLKPNLVTLNMTDATGKINSLAFGPDKIVKLKLERIDASATEDAEVSKMIPSTTQVLI